jgi:hypothetical protein
MMMGDNAPVPLKRKQHQVWFSSGVMKKVNSFTDFIEFV